MRFVSADSMVYHDCMTNNTIASVVVFAAPAVVPGVGVGAVAAIPIITGLELDDLKPTESTEWVYPSNGNKRYYLAELQNEQSKYNGHIVNVYASGAVRCQGHLISGSIGNRISTGNSREFTQKRQDKFVAAVQSALTTASGVSGVDNWEGGLTKVYEEIVNIAVNRGAARDRVAAVREIRQGLQLTGGNERGGNADSVDSSILEGLERLESVLDKAIKLKEV